MTNPTEQIAWLKTHFGDQCVEVQVEGDEPLLLDDPAFVYLTQSSQHHLFCVGYRERAAVGRREHVGRCNSGQMLFGLAVAPGQEAVLLLSGAAGSQVLRVPTKLVLSALALPEHRARVETLVDGWVELLISTLAVAPVPTRCDAVDAGTTLELAAAPIRSREGVLWIELPATPSRYGGVRITEVDKCPRQWPITATTWIFGGLASARLSRLSFHDTGEEQAATAGWADGARTSKSADVIARESGGRFIQEFYAFVIGVLARGRIAIEKTRLERDIASSEAERNFVGDALRQLALLGRGGTISPDLGGGDAFEQACRRIAEWMEIPPVNVPKPQAMTLSHIQTALSRLTAVRTRNVLLEGTWHENDSGALLGLMLGEPDGDDDESNDVLHPVALLPTSSGYELHDARKPGAQRVTAELAEALHPRAYQFYTPMPSRPIKPLDVLLYSSRRARRDIFFVLTLGLGLGSLSMLVPLLTGQVFDHLIPGAERALLLQLTFVLVFVYLGQALFDIARGLTLVRAQTRMDTTLEAGIWDRLLSLPLPFFRKYSAGELASRAAGIGGIRDLLAGSTLTALLGGLFSLWNLGFLFVIDPSLALAATGLVVVAIVPAVLATYYGLKRQRTVAAIDGKIEGLLLQLLSGIAKLRVTAAENRAFAVWARLFARRRAADLGAERVNARIDIFQSVYPILCSMVLFWMLAGAGKQKISTGMYLAFSAAFGIFLSATLSVIEALLHSLAAIPMYERAKPILTEHCESQGDGLRVELKGGIEVTHLSFRYDPDGPLILDDVSFQIKADEFVALVGPSGSGKSTLLRLMLGFENASAGGVFYDGQALSGLDVRAARKQIGVVMQNSRVMGGDIFTNIVGATGLTQEDAWTAARNAALDKDIEAMPMGMHTVISQGGGTLSGGQRQRLLIARSLATDPRVLFFDEATSALDNVTQATVSQSLENLRVTRVVIAHRLSTIRQADKIIVLEKGRVVQMGRFDDLVAVEGPFQNLAKRQMV